MEKKIAEDTILSLQGVDEIKKMDSKLLDKYKLPMMELFLDKTGDVFGFYPLKKSMFGNKSRFLIGSNKENKETNVYYHKSSWDIYGHKEFFSLGFFGEENKKSKLKEVINKKQLNLSDLEKNLDLGIGGGVWFFYHQ